VGGAVAAHLPGERKALRRSAYRAATLTWEGSESAEHGLCILVAVSKKALRRA
jgi:hypothetical protein